MRVYLTARCKTKKGNYDVVVVNLNSQGCCVVGERAFMCEHEAIRLNFDGMETLPGHISWVDAERAGIVFAQPLYGPVAEHLQRAYRPLD